MLLVRVRMLEDYARAVDGGHAPALHEAGEFYLVRARVALDMVREGVARAVEIPPQLAARFQQKKRFAARKGHRRRRRAARRKNGLGPDTFAAALRAARQRNEQGNA